jgi:hypothetical protein
MLKYRLGGRCGGNQPTPTYEDTQGVNKDFAKLLEQRRAMDTMLIYKEPTKTLEDSIHLRECLVKKEEPKIQIIKGTHRKKDIDFVLGNTN